MCGLRKNIGENEVAKMTEKEYLYCLCHIPPLGAVSILTLYEYFGSFGAIWLAKDRELDHVLTAGSRRLMNEKKRNALAEGRRKEAEFRKEYEGLEARGITFISVLDQEYPHRLSVLYDRPPGIFVRGKLPEETRPAVAIVGARDCTEYGRQLSEIFAGELAGEGVQIISGLAMGTDGAAHWGALKAGQPTYGILGCGADICYPRENYPLFERMTGQGGLITEFVPGTRPVPMNFPMRNRLISGFSDAVIIIEAKEKSGSLITADLALDQGKEVFAVPGRVTDAESAGCNRLIQSGAALASSPSDVLDFLGINNVKKLTLHKKTEKRLAKKENLVYSCLDLRPKHLEEIMKMCRLPVTDCMECLLELELSGMAVGTGNQYYCRKL